MKLLRNIGLYIGHLLTALIGTAVFTTSLSSLHRPASLTGALWQEVVAGFTFASLLGFVGSRISRDRLSAWTWVAVAPFFVLHIAFVLAGSNRNSVLVADSGIWARIFGLDCTGGPYIGRCPNFIEYTVPLVRTVAYSLGGLIGFQVFAADPSEETRFNPERTPGIDETNF